MYFSFPLLLSALIFYSVPRPSSASPLAGNHNCHGSTFCDTLDSHDCTEAYTGYSDLAKKNFTAYTAFVAESQGFFGSGGGCTAMYRCYDDSAYKSGVMGQTLFEAFEYIYSHDGCGPCGSRQLENKTACWVTLNYCSNCKATDDIPAVPETS